MHNPVQETCTSEYNSFTGQVKVGSSTLDGSKIVGEEVDGSAYPVSEAHQSRDGTMLEVVPTSEAKIEQTLLTG